MSENYIEYNLKLGYKTVVDKTFVPLCQGVISSLKKNSAFPDVGPLLTNLENAFKEYQAAIPAKQDNSPAKKAIKESKRTIVKFKLRTVGFHVLMVAENNYDKLKSSGFEMAKVYGTSVPPELPMPVILSMHTNGTPGLLIVKCKPAKAAKLYDVRISTDRETWTITTDNKSKVEVNNVPTEETVYVQLRYRNGNHETPWSSIMETRIFDTAVALPTAN